MGQVWIIIKSLHRGFDDSPEIHRLVALCLRPFESKINRVRPTVEDYYCAKFQVILIRGFRFIMLNRLHYTKHAKTVLQHLATIYYYSGLLLKFFRQTTKFYCNPSKVPNS